MQEDLLECERVIQKLLGNRTKIRVLEAGCGSMSHINFHHEMYLVGLDISQSQLDRNTLLSEKYLHDIQVDNYPARDFDLVICWDVLEHLPHPERAMKNFASAVSEDGIILLASPNVMCVRGLIAKFTPHWFHVLFYRYVYGHEDAGKEGYWPFKSYHRFSMTMGAIKRFASRTGLRVEYCKLYEIENPEKQHKLFNAVWTVANKVVEILSFGIIGTDAEESFIVVLRRPVSTASSVA